MKQEYKCPSCGLNEIYTEVFNGEIDIECPVCEEIVTISNNEIKKHIDIIFDELNILQKYFYNQVGYFEFEEAMMTVYNDKQYIEPLWSQFQKNAIGFLVARSERKVFEYFQNKINEIGYKG